ncbi:hypothetical protein Tco_0085696 [Tanacetum coccineum]
MGLAIGDLRNRIDDTLLEDTQRRWMSDSQNSLREFYKTDVISISESLSNTLKELKQELIEEVREMLNIFESMEQKVAEKSPNENIFQNEIDRLLETELEKSSSDSKDIQANLLKRIKILENDFKRSQAQSIDFELKLHHKKKKMACDVSWKSRLSTLNDKNVLLKTQVDSVTYAYADVRSQNQDLLMTISKLKNKIKTIEKGKNVNTKFDKSETSGTLLCVTPLLKNIVVKAKKVSNTKVNADRSEPVTSHSIPKNKQIQKQSVESSNSVRRPKSKDTKSKDRVLKNKNDKRPSAHVRKMPSSVSIDSNKRETLHSNVIQLVIWIVNSGCSKHMTGNLQLLINFVEKFMGTVRFRNDHFAAITGYGDYVQGNLTICHNLKGDDLLTDSRDSNLYTIPISEMVASSSVCLMSRATSTKSWLWHCMLSHLNFACEQGKSKKASLLPKLVPST